MPPNIGMSPPSLRCIIFQFSGLFAYLLTRTKMIQPMINAATEVPSVEADTLPFDKYSRMAPKEAPTTSAESIMKNLPFVTSFGCARLGFGNSFIVVRLDLMARRRVGTDVRLQL